MAPRLADQAEGGNRQAGIKMRELREIIVAGDIGPKEGQGIAVIFFTVLDEAEIIADVGAAGVSLIRLAKQGFRLFILFLGKMQNPQLERDVRIGGLDRSGLFECCTGITRPIQSAMNKALIIESVDALRIQTERLLQLLQGRIISLLVVSKNRPIDENRCLEFPGFRRLSADSRRRKNT